MRARRPLLFVAIVGVVAAWLIWHDGSTRPETTTGPEAAAKPAPAPPLADTVNAERTKEPPAAKDDAAQGESKGGAEDATVPSRPKPRGFWIRLLSETDGSPVADAQCCVGPYDVELFRTAMLEWGTAMAVRTHEGSKTFAEVAQATARSAGDGCASVPVAEGRAVVVSVGADGFVPVYFVANTRGHELHESHDTRERALEVGLARAASLEGVVLDAGRRPLAGLEVLAEFPHDELRRPRPNFESTEHQLARGSTTTDVAGRFRFDGLPADVAIELKALRAIDPTAIRSWERSRYPFAEMEQWLDPGERAGSSGRLRGHAGAGSRRRHGAAPVGGGVGLGHAAVARDCVETTSNAVGEFAFDTAAPGDVVLRVTPGDHRHSGADRKCSRVGEQRRRRPRRRPPARRAADRARGRSRRRGDAALRRKSGRPSSPHLRRFEPRRIGGGARPARPRGRPARRRARRVDQFATGARRPAPNWRSTTTASTSAS